MAFAAVGALGSAQSKTAGTTIAITTSATVNVGHLIVVTTAWDNGDTSDVEGIRLGVTDSAGNLYRWLGGWVNAQGGAGLGAEIAIFCSVVDTQLASGGTITVTGGSVTARAATAHEFTIGSTSVCLSGKVNRSDDGADPAGLTLSGLPSREYLFLHGVACEGPDTTSFTWDSNYTQFTGNGTTGGTAATNMSVRGGYRILTATGDSVNVSAIALDFAQEYLAIREYNPDTPNPSILDSFNRANETPIASPWAKTDASGLKLVSNAVGVQSGGTPARASHQTGFSSDLLAAATVAVDVTSGGDRIGVAAHVSGTGANTWAGYTYTADARTGNDLLLLRYTPDATVIGSLTVPTLAHTYIEVSANDVVLIKTDATVVEGWFKPSGGSWHLLAAVDDSTARNGTVAAVIRDTGTSARLDDFYADALAHLPFISSVSAVYTPLLVGTVAAPFIASVTVVYAPTLTASGVHVPFLASATSVFGVFSLFVDVTGVGAGVGGEAFPVQLAPNGTSQTATLAVNLGTTGSLLSVTGDSGFPSGAFVVTINSEVLYVVKITAGSYRIRGRAMSNTTAASHTAGASVAWTDSYDMARASTENAAASFTDDLQSTGTATYPGALICSDSSQAYLGASRYPMHVTSLLGVFDTGAGSGGTNRLAAAAANAVCTPTGVSDDCPDALSAPGFITADITAGDVALCRYTNPEASILELGQRSAALVTAYGLYTVDSSNVDNTPAGTVVDGTAEGTFLNPLGPGIAPDTGEATNHDVPFITETLPGSSRAFSHGGTPSPPNFSDRGQPIGSLAVRQGNRRVPFWRSFDWTDLGFAYSGFGTDCNFVQALIELNGIQNPVLPTYELPGPQDISGPNAVWDDGSYYFASCFYVALFRTPFFVIGPVLSGGGGGGTTGPAPTVSFPGGGGSGSATVTFPVHVLGGSGGDIPAPTASIHRFEAQIV